MQKQVVGHFETTAPVVTITFIFEKLDPALAVEILSRLRIDTDTPVETCYSEKQSKQVTLVTRTNLTYSVHKDAVAVIICYRAYDSRTSYYAKRDAEGIASTLEAALQVFDR